MIVIESSVIQGVVQFKANHFLTSKVSKYLAKNKHFITFIKLNIFYKKLYSVVEHNEGSLLICWKCHITKN